MSAAKRITLTLSDGDYIAYSKFAKAHRLSLARTVMMFATRGIALHHEPPVSPPPVKLSIEDQLEAAADLLLGDNR